MKSLRETIRKAGITGAPPAVRVLAQRSKLTPPFTLWQVMEAMGAALGAGDEPWFDPTRVRLPSYDEQTVGLSGETLDAQRTPRVVQNLPVTGLPLEATFDAEMAGL